MPIITHYSQRLIESPEINKVLADVYWGIEPPQDVTIRLSNADGYLTQLMQTQELRYRRVRIRRYEPEESGEYKVQLELMGVITDYNILDEAEFTISIVNPDPLQTELPKKTYELTDWTEGRPLIYNPIEDVGKPYNLCLGHPKKVPLRYVHCDYTNDRYDYIIGYGPIEAVTAVYRDRLKVNPSEYTVYLGDQTAPYKGYAFIRFAKEQRSFTGALHTLTADVKGLKFGTDTTASRNFAVIIRNLLENDTYGLGQGVNIPSFNQAALDTAGWYCDGCISEKRMAQDIINDLLMCCRGRLDKNEDGEWCLYINKAKALLGTDINLQDNIISMIEYKKTPTSEALKKVIVNYGWNEWESKYMYRYERDVFTTFGEEREYDLPFVHDHTTADIITSFLQKAALYYDTQLTMEVGMAARNIKVWDLIDVVLPRFNISDDFQVFSITRKVNSFILGLKSYNPMVFAYTPAPKLNIDPVPDATVVLGGFPLIVSVNNRDYKAPENPYYEKPRKPINIQGISWSFLVGSAGEVTARLVGQAQKHPDEKNFAYLKVGIRIYQSDGTASSVPFKWYQGYEYTRWTGNSTTSWLWRVVLDFPASAYCPSTDGTGWVVGGLNDPAKAKVKFDAAVVAVNTFGRESDPVYFLNETVAWKWSDVGSIPVAPPPVNQSSLISTNAFKQFTWYWADATVVDLRDYHVQVSSSPTFSPILKDAYTRSTFYTYTTDLDFSSLIYFRVRPRNTTYIEGYAASPNENWVDCTAVVSETVNIPNNSIEGRMLDNDIAGLGLVFTDFTVNKRLDVSVDGNSLEIADDKVRVKAGGIDTTHIKDGVVTGAKLFDGAITTAKIQDGAITTAKIQDGAITTVKIGNDQVTDAKIRWYSTTTPPDMSPAPAGAIIIDIGGTNYRIPFWS